MEPVTGTHQMMLALYKAAAEGKLEDYYKGQMEPAMGIHQMMLALYKAAADGKLEDYCQGQMEPAMGIHQMKPALYKAAVEGKLGDYDKALQQTTDGAGCQGAPNGNTVLHVAVLHGHRHLVEKILKEEKDRAASSMLIARNNKNETVLHCAAEKGYTDIVSVLISPTKDLESGIGMTEIIRITDNVKDTALHKAVRKGHLDVVKLLVEEDNEFLYPANDDGETPIYIAAESQFYDCLAEILKTCKHPTYGGPLGRNALHAAILSTGISGSARSSVMRLMPFLKSSLGRHVDTTDCTKLLLKRQISLCEMTDDFGWTPLHYAVKNRGDETVRMILEEKSSAAYICAGRGDEWTTIFHLAARYGNVQMMKYISNSCPDCWVMINSKYQNVLHEAMLSGRLNVIKYILKSPQIDNLIYGKDEDGNTPLHLFASSNWNTLQSIASETLLTLSSLAQKCFIFNKQHRTPLDMTFEHRAFSFLDTTTGGKLFRSGSKSGPRADLTENSVKRNDIVNEDKKINLMLRMSKTNIIVATLILTITFAAGLTVPGRYDSNPGSKQGKPILLRDKAFKTFVIADTIAFVSAILSIFLYIGMVGEASSSSSRKYWTVLKFYLWQTTMLYYASGTVVIAFLSGMYATLAPLRGLAIGVLVLAFSIPYIVYLDFCL